MMLRHGGEETATRKQAGDAAAGRRGVCVLRRAFETCFVRLLPGPGRDAIAVFHRPHVGLDWKHDPDSIPFTRPLAM